MLHTITRRHKLSFVHTVEKGYHKNQRMHWMKIVEKEMENPKVQKSFAEAPPLFAKIGSRKRLDLKCQLNTCA